MGLTDAELTAIRDAADTYLPDSATIQTATQSVGAMGGNANSYANSATGVSCRLDPTTSQAMTEAVRGLRLSADQTMVLNVAYTQTINASDRVIVGGVTYEVVQILNQSQSYATLTRAIVKVLL